MRDLRVRGNEHENLYKELVGLIQTLKEKAQNNV